ncbi:electron transfer flavoprotein subunit beta/FixA family protein [Flavilitoribacter nigricans]|uniref:Electron transfer flavoprotein subunit beta n=1 Tax=Flavilitoribacter nigricans (strain ATCC 23147 / DSM 23189 / NBRC 102662 / NCIMB 1420 / SS-2) TaxID=1122177 RepID=A0A2D0NA60_FLAN2|nr:electron transfer flavoprotein subunit beta/FixA family protein [Flavilitoribacter nigricans]PHN05049.1 electron transfer flavoprotein subunit alpha [Flavilitoribacter nigricans DSM 23189 = NBRC 102662]
MKLLVCVSKTPDTTTKIKFTSDNSELDTNGVQYIMNPYDEWYALVRALELKEAQGGSVTILNVGPAENDTVIRKGLAIGADEAVRINADPQSSLNVAKQIAEYAKGEGFDIVFFGKETIDYNGSEVSAMVAELLDMPFISYASHMEMDGNNATIKRDIEGGVETLSVDTPFVISAAKGLAEQRIPNMRGIMMAKRKPLKVVPAATFDDPVATVSYELPPEKGQVKLIDPENMDELVRLLHEEAKVI